MLVGGRFRGHSQKVVIELHTLHAIGSQIENAVAEVTAVHTVCFMFPYHDFNVHVASLS